MDTRFLRQLVKLLRLELEVTKLEANRRTAENMGIKITGEPSETARLSVILNQLGYHLELNRSFNFWTITRTRGK
jgi:hypothetical protein